MDAQPPITAKQGPAVSVRQAKKVGLWVTLRAVWLQGEAGSGLSDTVRKYRQSVFKLNYKIKKNAGRPRLSRPPGLPAIPATGAARKTMAQTSQHFLDLSVLHVLYIYLFCCIYRQMGTETQTPVVECSNVSQQAISCLQHHRPLAPM